MSVSQPAPPASDLLITRLEAVPISGWHVRPRLAVGSATFFDAFDTLTLAFVLPALVAPWNLSMPTLYSSVYSLPLAQSLRAATLNNVAQILILLVCALTIDRVGRKHWTVTYLAAGAVLMTLLGWFGVHSIIAVIAITTVAYGIVSSINAVPYLYTPEIYPTRFRARAAGAARCWVRLSSAAGQLLVGYLVSAQGAASVFLMFAGVSMVGALGATLMLETRNRPLEEIAG
jgi:putative MFS transporter